ncbi:OmpA family protein [Mangrovivirga sp. M17]|uniref:OmpA family protein n=1 Tax=Mangrovivirga halotolerans TaxID=2993936 RepID=A0ABT3RRI7_9BACT|nr:OmpA family protein [Mangrovivirga halotolerans]MCX2744407.1 OmpA family protein [Mangrovivirga halotolerans]
MYLKTISKVLLSISIIVFLGCKANNTQKGAAIGAGSGAVIGGIIGNQSDNTAIGAIIGATVGGTAGALIGRHMDKQAEELREDLEGAEVERVGEGIKITFDSGLMFPLDEYTLTEATKENLDEMSEILKKYEDTNILIEGHTDATGSESYNQALSEKRANRVTEYLAAHGVDTDRLQAVGYGESQPIATNDTEAGRQQNRRVEVAIFANEEMKEAAEDGEL